jgi:hypothetical protein
MPLKYQELGGMNLTSAESKDDVDDAEAALSIPFLRPQMLQLIVAEGSSAILRAKVVSKMCIPSSRYRKTPESNASSRYAYTSSKVRMP